MQTTQEKLRQIFRRYEIDELSISTLPLIIKDIETVVHEAWSAGHTAGWDDCQDAQG
jgi:hypothetical protein